MTVDLKKLTDFMIWWREKVHGHRLSDDEYDRVCHRFEKHKTIEK